MTKAFLNNLSFSKLLKIAAFGACMASPIVAQDNAEIVFWQSVSESGSVAKLQAYIDTFPNGIYRALAEIQIKEIQGDVVVQTTEPTNSSQEDCDRLAGHSGDETLPVAPTSYNDLKAHAQEAIEACKNAQATSNDPRYAYQLGRSYRAAGEGKNAWNWFVHASLDGHIRATYRIALTFYNGSPTTSTGASEFPVEQNIPEALKRFKTIADQGHAPSAYYAGWILAAGEADGTNDFAAAYPYLDQADQAGIGDAYYPLGFLYEKGLHVTPSYDKAVDYYRRAVNFQTKNWQAAQFNLADMLLYRLENPDYSSAESREDILYEALDLLADLRTDDNVNSHDRYVNLLLRELVSVADFATALGRNILRSDNGYNPHIDEEGYLARFNNLFEQLYFALIERHETFPRIFPDQTPSYISENANIFYEVNRSKVFAGYDYGQLSEFLRNNRASECVTGTKDITDAYVSSSVTNTCDREIDVLFVHEVDYNSNQHEDLTEKYDVTLRPNGSYEHKTHYTKLGEGTAHADWLTCYAAQGLIIYPRSADCGRIYVDEYRENDKAMDAEIGRLAEELMGQPLK